MPGGGGGGCRGVEEAGPNKNILYAYVPDTASEHLSCLRAAVALTGLYMQESSRHLVSSVEVFEVISIDIGGGDVCSASKPPLTWNPVPLLRLKVPAG